MWTCSLHETREHVQPEDVRRNFSYLLLVLQLVVPYGAINLSARALLGSADGSKTREAPSIHAHGALWLSFCLAWCGSTASAAGCSCNMPLRSCIFHRQS